MNKKQAHHPAYPLENLNNSKVYSGMSIRTVIAKDIMAAMISNSQYTPNKWGSFVSEAVKATDALIEELTKDDRSL